MANANDEIRNYLRNVIGTGVGIEGTNRANAIIEEGVESVAGGTEESEEGAGNRSKIKLKFEEKGFVTILWMY